MPRFLCAQLRICLKRPGFAAIIGLKAIASVDRRERRGSPSSRRGASTGASQFGRGIGRHQEPQGGSRSIAGREPGATRPQGGRAAAAAARGARGRATASATARAGRIAGRASGCASGCASGRASGRAARAASWCRATSSAARTAPSSWRASWRSLRARRCQAGSGARRRRAAEGTEPGPPV